MKRILLFACLVSLTVAKMSDDIWMQYTSSMKGSAEKCVQQLGLPEDFIDRFVTERYTTDIDTMGCLRASVLSDSHLIVDGNISLDAFNEFINTVSGEQPELEEKIRRLVQFCTEKSAHLTNVCEKALEFSNCCSDELEYVTKHI